MNWAHTQTPSHAHTLGELLESINLRKRLALTMNDWRHVEGNITGCVVLLFRKGSFFEGSHLPLVSLIVLMWAWAYSMPLHHASEFAYVSKCTAITWYNYFREVCAHHLSNGDHKLGGCGVVVEIDETKIAHRKYNRGRRVRDQWCVIITFREFFLQ